MTNGHELSGGGNAGVWGGDAGQRENIGEKKWDKCNSIINKVYLKKKQKYKLGPVWVVQLVRASSQYTKV